MKQYELNGYTIAFPEIPEGTRRCWFTDYKNYCMKGITALVCPKQKIVKIYDGKTIKAIYPISIDIPKTKVEKEFSGYDWGAWSVSDRDYTYTKKVTVYDESVISDIRQKAIEYYKRKNVKPSPEETKK